MPRKSTFVVLVLIVTLLVPAVVQAQDQGSSSPSSKRALALSLLLPGLGHRYTHGGDWDGAASLFAVADASFWLGLFGTEWRRDQVVESYRTLAASRAGAQIEGKDRRFFLTLASYMSSDEYLEVQLRNRAWDEIDYVDDPAFQWAWASEADFQRYRELRSDADALGRRRTLIVSALVANRLIAGITAIRAANRARSDSPSMSLSFTAPPRGLDMPVVNVRVRW